MSAIRDRTSRALLAHARGSRAEGGSPRSPGAAPDGHLCACRLTSMSRPPSSSRRALFLDVIGEALRARTYVFTDPDGEELCLRPDLTVPTCRLHLARHPAAPHAARYCYSGPAFRYQPGGATSAHPERVPPGRHRVVRRRGPRAGRCRRARPDRGGAARSWPRAAFQLRFGDLGLFTALLDALPMPQRWRRRLRHHFWRPEAFRAELARLTSRAALQAHGLPRELMDALDPARPQRGPGARRGLPGAVGAGADRHAHVARDRRAPARRSRRCARGAVAGGHGRG